MTRKQETAELEKLADFHDAAVAEIQRLETENALLRAQIERVSVRVDRIDLLTTRSRLKEGV